MDRASLEAARAIVDRYPDRRDGLVVCGAGNNGGDGYAVARHLADAGWDIHLATPRGQSPRTPDAMTMATITRTLGLRARTFTPAMLNDDRLVIDALIGLGGRGAPTGTVGSAVEAIGRSGATVVALDAPSGVSADTGEVPGVAVRAALTVTFHGDMPGLHIEPGRGHTGEVVVTDIGIPASVTSAPAAWLADERVGGLPAISPDRDKYGAGAVLVVAGSTGMTGAAVLSAQATLRAGAGLTVAAVPASVQPIVARQMTEVMTAPIDDVDGYLTADSVAGVVAQSHRVGAVALGPGLGRAEATTAFVRQLLHAIDLPMVLDADGLWHLSRRPSVLAGRAAPTVITPHAGEAARLLGVERQQVEATRLASAKRLADASRAVVVLKGPGTIICDPAGTVVIDALGTAALATAGSGDVLTGVIGACLARGLPALEAATIAVAVHGRAASVAARGVGTIARDLIDALPLAIGGV